MKRILLFVLLFIGVTPCVVTAQTSIVVDGRTGVREGHLSYKLLEVSVVHDQWIMPHVGFLAFDKASEYSEFFVGGGRKFVESEKFKLQGEMYVLQTVGPFSEHARFLQPAAEADYEFSEKFRTEAAGFAYLPLGGVGRKQFVLEHVKLERVVGPRFKFGGGYGSRQGEGDEWKESPFASVTVTPQFGKYGSVEVWLQKVERSAQLQIRYHVDWGTEK